MKKVATDGAIGIHVAMEMVAVNKKSDGLMISSWSWRLGRIIKKLIRMVIEVPRVDLRLHPRCHLMLLPLLLITKGRNRASYPPLFILPAGSPAFFVQMKSLPAP